MKPQELACFDGVKGAIGVELAIKELQKVIDCDCANLVVDEVSLNGAFHWAATPQGYRFWREICLDEV